MRIVIGVLYGTPILWTLTRQEMESLSLKNMDEYLYRDSDILRDTLPEHEVKLKISQMDSEYPGRQKEKP